MNRWVEPRSVQGLEVSAVSEIVDGEGDAAALQLVFTDGSSLVCVVWTDWTMLFERLDGAGLPDYLWPPEAHSAKPLLPERSEVSSVRVVDDEIGQTMGVDFSIGQRLVSARSFGGEIVVSVG